MVPVETEGFILVLKSGRVLSSACGRVLSSACARTACLCEDKHFGASLRERLISLLCGEFDEGVEDSAMDQ